MDATAMALRQPVSSSYSLYSAAVSSCSKELKNSFGSVCVDRKRPEIEILSSGFCDRSHLQYYNSDFGAGRMRVTSGKMEKNGKDQSLKKKKKQLKLVKGLTRDLSALTQMGFGLDSDGALLDQVKGNMISEAAELLLEQLQKIRADEKEQKRKMKEERARLKAAARMQNSVNCGMSSDSSSSESSDSECGEVVDMKDLKCANTTQSGLQQVIDEATSRDSTPIIPTITSPVPVLPSAEEKITLQLSSLSTVDTKVDKLGETRPSTLAAPMCSQKIEVCMGGKCKKSGAGALLEEFQRVVGVEGAVSGCKCMGKCRDGPNVKVLNGVDGGFADSSVKAPSNSLCIGVGVEDVNMIVANFMGENHSQLAFAPVS